MTHLMVYGFTTITDVRLHAQHCCISDGIISTNVEPCDNIGHKRKYLYLIENKQVMILKSLAQAAKRDFLSWDFCHSVGTSVAAALNHIVGRVRRTLWNMEANDAITRQ
jgi:hypothetical protein